MAPTAIMALMSAAAVAPVIADVLRPELILAHRHPHRHQLRHVEQSDHKVASLTESNATRPHKKRVKEVAQAAPVSDAKVAPMAIVADPTVAELQQGFSELKQRRTNALQLKQAIAANAALVRESGVLAKISRGHAQAEAVWQVKQSVQVLKETEAMADRSRLDALQGARVAMQEAAAIRAVADQLTQEASQQVKLFKGVDSSSSAALKVNDAPAARATSNADDSDAIVVDTPTNTPVSQEKKIQTSLAARDDGEDDDVE